MEGSLDLEGFNTGKTPLSAKEASAPEGFRRSREERWVQVQDEHGAADPEASLAWQGICDDHPNMTLSDSDLIACPSENTGLPLSSLGSGDRNLKAPLL